jgi:sugar (pentulose or hexulose) kinase
MEGVALAVAHNVETMQNGTGTVTELRVTGGPASSNLWAQILADVIGVDIVRPVVTESAPLGDAMLAAVGIGQLPDLSVARQAVEIERRFQPDDRNAKRYRSSYERYKALIERLGPLLVSDGDG